MKPAVAKTRVQRAAGQRVPPTTPSSSSSSSHAQRCWLCATMEGEAPDRARRGAPAGAQWRERIRGSQNKRLRWMLTWL